MGRPRKDEDYGGDGKLLWDAICSRGLENDIPALAAQMDYEDQEGVNKHLRSQTISHTVKKKFADALHMTIEQIWGSKRRPPEEYDLAWNGLIVNAEVAIGPELAELLRNARKLTPQEILRLISEADHIRRHRLERAGEVLELHRPLKGRPHKPRPGH